VKFRDFSITFWRNFENLFFILADLIFGPINKFYSKLPDEGVLDDFLGQQSLVGLALIFTSREYFGVGNMNAM
jgi:hypothetical protein